MKEQEEKQNGKRTLIASGIALATAASMLVGGLFQSPADLLHEEEQQVVVMEQADPDLDGGDDGAPEEEESDEERRGGLRKTVRQRILAMPLAVRMLVILPVWLIGSVCNAALSALWSGVSPILNHVLGSLLLIALLFAAFLAAVKAMFPDLPLRKIINRKTIPWLLLGGLVLSAADRLLLAFVEEYGPVRIWIVSLLFLAFLAAAVFAFALRTHRRRIAEPVAAQPSVLPKEQVLLFEDPSGYFRLRSNGTEGEHRE